MADYVVKCPNLTIFVGICPYSLMDRISDSGSDGCGSIPHGGTKKVQRQLNVFFVPGVLTPVAARQPLSGAYRLPLMLQSGVPAAAIFCENLADADDAALMRLVISLKTVLYPSELRLLD